MQKNSSSYFNSALTFLLENNKTISLAESCTGGMIASRITDLSGVSKIFKVSYITYSNEAKIELLAVNPHVLAIKGAVSADTVEEMLLGTLSESKADFAGAVSGIAGPDGGTREKPVGTVFIGVAARNGQMEIKQFLFKGDRQEVRKQTVDSFFIMLDNFLKSL